MLHLPPSRANDGFERLLDVGEEKQQQQKEQFQRRSALLLLALAVVVATTATIVATTTRNNPAMQASTPNHEHTLPTLLSIVDPVTGKYVNSLENELYQDLKGVEMLEHRFLRDDNNELPILTLDKTHLQKLYQPLTVSWTRTRDVDEHDILALYCPHDADHGSFQEAATLQQVAATSSRHHGGRRKEEKNSTNEEWFIPSFSITKHETCQFRLFDRQQDDDETLLLSLQLLATSPILHIPAATRTPTGIHLALSNDPTEMVIQFNTAEKGTPIAMYGSTDSSPEKKVKGTSHTYTAEDLCGAPANTTEAGKFQDPGMLHVIRLTNLEPNQVYTYKVGLASGQGITWSDVSTFTAPPVVGDDIDIAPFSYVVYGDQGCPATGWGNGSLWTAAMATRDNNLRAVHHFGDLSYAMGAAHIWDEWLHMVEPFARKVPLMIGVGNHEYDHMSGGEEKDPSGLKNASHGFMPEWGNFGADSQGECGVPTSNRFTMPANGNGVFWYSFDFANVHTIMLSSEHNLTKGSDQHEWFVEDLKSVNRTLTPWLILELHRPLYQSEFWWVQNAVGVGMRYEIEDLLKEFQVDLVLAGHYHSYLRTCDGLYHSKCHNGGPMHICVGSAGAMLDSAMLYPNHWTETFIQQEYGYGRITVANASALHFEFVRAGGAADDETDDAGQVRDDVWLMRDRSTLNG